MYDMLDMMMATGATVMEMLEISGVSPEEFYEEIEEIEEPEVELHLFWCRNGENLDKVLADIKRSFPSAYVKRTFAEDTSKVLIQCVDCDSSAIFEKMDKVAMEI